VECPDAGEAVGLQFLAHRQRVGLGLRQAGARLVNLLGNTRVAEGAMPIMVQAGGTANGTQYASVFATREFPLARVWTVTGAPAGAVDQLDTVVRRFMTAHAIRAGAVACGRNGNIVLARGYTWAEAGYPTTGTDTMFRIASLSKMYTAACVARLVATGRLAWDTQAFPFLLIFKGYEG
jgi:CubicO group peptidase (beta-lactamase class C family)